MWTKLNNQLSGRQRKSDFNRHMVEGIIKDSLNQNSLEGEVHFLAGGASNLSFLLGGNKKELVIRVFGPEGNSHFENKVEAQILNECFFFLEKCREFKLVRSNLGALVMPKLQQIHASVDEVLILQRGFENILNNQNSISVPPERTISVLIESAKKVCVSMESNGILQESTSKVCLRLLAVLSSELTNYDKVFCHGDLSPANILADSEQLIAIDWEDRICGIPDYDFLYWLTFLDNLPLVNRKNLYKTRLPLELSIATMVMIILLKEYANSMAAGADLNRRMSTQERVNSLFLQCDFL